MQKEWKLEEKYLVLYDNNRSENIFLDSFSENTNIKEYKIKILTFTYTDTINLNLITTKSFTGLTLIYIKLTPATDIDSINKTYKYIKEAIKKFNENNLLILIFDFKDADYENFTNPIKTLVHEGILSMFIMGIKGELNFSYKAMEEIAEKHNFFALMSLTSETVLQRKDYIYLDEDEYDKKIKNNFYNTEKIKESIRNIYYIVEEANKKNKSGIKTNKVITSASNLVQEYQKISTLIDLPIPNIILELNK